MGLTSVKWFDRGVAALQRISSIDLGGLYFCPVCIRGFDREHTDLLTLEHVPPKSIGGREIVLSCKECNNFAGTELDSHLAERDNFIRGWTSRALPATLNTGDLRVKVDIARDGAAMTITAIPQRNRPLIGDALMEHVREGGGRDMFLEIRLRHDARLVEIALLRSAYLAAFATLGYSYILQPSLDLVRRQVQNPELTLLDHFSWRAEEDAAQTPKIGYSMTNSQLRVVAAQIGERVIILPGLAPAVDTYAALALMAKINRKLPWSLTELAWPTEPMHAIDLGQLSLPFTALELRSRPPGESRTSNR